MNGARDDQFDVDPEEWRKQFWGDDASTKTDTGPKGNGADSAVGASPIWACYGYEDGRRQRCRSRSSARLGNNGLLDAAVAAACPVDYVVAPLLASVSTLIGNARWAQAWPGWSEPPHLWTVVVGDSGTGKSPGADCLMRDVLPTIERRMIGDYPDRLREWQGAVEFDKTRQETLEG